MYERLKQSEYKSDAFYIKNIKSPLIREKDKEVYKYELYTKYLPLIMKTAHKFNLNREDSEDFIAEGYVLVARTLDYVKESTIDEKFSFGYFLRFNLQNAGIKHVKTCIKEKESFGGKVSWESMKEHSNREDLIYEYDDFKSVETMTNIDTALRLLKKKASERDYIIFKKRLLEGATDKEIANCVGLSSQRIRNILKQLTCYLQPLMYEY